MTDYSKAASANTEKPENYKFDFIPAKNIQTIVIWEYPEFQSICPISERHDQGTVTIKYKPKDKILESKSMRDYLTLWRNKKNWQEHVTNEIADAVYRAIEPEGMIIEIEWAPRGGIFATTISRRGDISGI
ncbi:MAG: GTP cyclohydrolase I [Spirochaetes bacterium]|jgi:7-cyano-7-deazaguanine reductase|nr:GTP cyclohydrolase I [Spirochaetota bacterium]